MPSSTKFRDNAPRRGQALLGLLAVLVIGFFIYWQYLGPHENKNGALEQSEVKTALDQAQGVAIDSNLSQIRQFINMYRSDHDGKAPDSFDDLKRESHFPDSMFYNPLDNKPYDYDPTTGRIWVQGGTPHGGSHGGGYSTAASNVASGNNPDGGPGGSGAATGGISIPNVPAVP